MAEFILPLSDSAAIDPENVGPKAANLASLTQAGLPTPGGFSLTAAAYRQQLHHIGIDEMLAQYNEADLPTSRKLSIAIRLAIHQQPIAPEILEPLLAARDAVRRSLGGALLGADRGPQGREFCRPVRKLLGAQRRN
jgi:phosphoenolpyruvate synthase/pyruvate phosphate dikinase